MTIGKERDISRTNNMTDLGIAVKFYNDFNVSENFGALVANEDFNQWIFDLGFDGMDHGWTTKNEINAWNGHRRAVRDYIKRGVMSELYAGLGLEPYCVEVKEHGQNTIITRFEDYVVDSFKMLASTRQKNIKNKDRSLKKNFKVLTEIFEVDRVDAIIQNSIIDAQNQMRLAFEKSCGDILQRTVEDTIRSIKTTQAIAKRISNDYTKTDYEED